MNDQADTACTSNSKEKTLLTNGLDQGNVKRIDEILPLMNQSSFSVEMIAPPVVVFLRKTHSIDIDFIWI